MFSVHSKPNGQNQTADSQIRTSSGRWPQNTTYLPPTPAAIAFQPIGSRPDVATFTNNVVGNVRSGIDGLVSSGFRNIILVTPYDLGVSKIFAQFNSDDATTRSLANQYSVAVRNQFATLYTPGVNTYFLDTLALLNHVQANPSAYGFAHAASSDNGQDVQTATPTGCLVSTGSQIARHLHAVFHEGIRQARHHLPAKAGGTESLRQSGRTAGS